MSAIHQLLLGHGGGGEVEVTEAADTFTGVEDGAVSSVSSGTGWDGPGLIEDPANVAAVDIFTGLTDGALVDFDSGTGAWDEDGIIDDVPPVADAATDADGTDFTAHWHSFAGSGATGYRLDISTASDFSSFVSGHEDLDVGMVTSYDFEGPGEDTYYYRVRSYNGVTTTPSSNVVTVAPPTPAGIYHRVELRAQGQYVSVCELKFKLADNSDYPLTSATLTSSTSWEFASLSTANNGVINDLPTHGNVGANNWAHINIETPSPVSVKAVLVATQVNYNGSFNMGNGLRYLTSTDGSSWTLVKEILGNFSTDSGYLEFNVEP